jgi:hypothetical protein
MAKRKATRRAKPVRQGKKRRSSKRPVARAKKAAARRRRSSPARKAATPKRKSRAAGAAKRVAGPAAKTPRLNRARRTLEEVVPTPPSSLNMNRHGSAARTGRAELAERLQEHHGMTAVTGGDVDVDLENAYFSGDEAPGGDNPTPDQDIVDDIGKALGVEYQDNEELQAADKVIKRDKHRWELDPASSDDYKDRK